MEEIVLESDECSVNDVLETEVTHGDRNVLTHDGTGRKYAENPMTDRPSLANIKPLDSPPSSVQNRKRMGTNSPEILDMDMHCMPQLDAVLDIGRHRKQWGWRPEVVPGDDQTSIEQPKLVPNLQLAANLILRTQRTYQRWQAMNQVRPQDKLCLLTSEPPMDRYAALRPEPTMANGYYTVRRPARTYERRRWTNHEDSVNQNLQLLPYASTFAQQDVAIRPPSQRQDFHCASTRGLPHTMSFKAREKAKFAAQRSSNSKALPWEQSRSEHADFHADTTLYLSNQLGRIKQDAANGNEGAFLLLEQIQAFGKCRHQFSKRTLLMCARWKDRSHHSYNYARSMKLFALPTAETVTKHYSQLSLSS